MQNLAEILGKKYKSELRYFRAVEIIQTQWVILVKKLSTFLQPKNIYKNKLVIECNNPVWMSEISAVEHEIVLKVNELLKKHRSSVSIIGIKLIFNSEFVFKDKLSKVSPPEKMKERISWNIENKKNRGLGLCKTCQTVWDITDVCTFCRLTS